MKTDLGSRRWVIAEGYIPSGGVQDDRALESHETFCILNAGSEPARVEIVLYFADRAPAGPYRAEIPAERVLHLRANDLSDPEPVPRDMDYAAVLTADAPVVVQHTRLDSRPQALALMTTLAHPAG